MTHRSCSTSRTGTCRILFGPSRLSNRLVNSVNHGCRTGTHPVEARRVSFVRAAGWRHGLGVGAAPLLHLHERMCISFMCACVRRHVRACVYLRVCVDGPRSKLRPSTSCLDCSNLLCSTTRKYTCALACLCAFVLHVCIHACEYQSRAHSIQPRIEAIVILDVWARTRSRRIRGTRGWRRGHL